MNPAFFQHIENILHTERIDAYRQDVPGTPRPGEFARPLCFDPEGWIGPVDRKASKPLAETMSPTLDLTHGMPRLVDELHAQFAESAKLEAAIRNNLKGLGY